MSSAPIKPFTADAKSADAKSTAPRIVLASEEIWNVLSSIYQNWISLFEKKCDIHHNLKASVSSGHADWNSYIHDVQHNSHQLRDQYELDLAQVNFDLAKLSLKLQQCIDCIVQWSPVFHTEAVAEDEASIGAVGADGANVVVNGLIKSIKIDLRMFLFGFVVPYENNDEFRKFIRIAVENYISQIMKTGVVKQDLMKEVFDESS